MEKGLFEANLGNGLYKKRIARPNQGKSDGYRVLLAFKQKNHLFFEVKFFAYYYSFGGGATRSNSSSVVTPDLTFSIPSLCLIWT